MNQNEIKFNNVQNEMKLKEYESKWYFTEEKNRSEKCFSVKAFRILDGKFVNEPR